MVGIFSPGMLEMARFKAASLEESSSWASLTMIFKDTMLLGSAALLGGEGVAEKGAQEENNAGKESADEAAKAVGVMEVEADVGEELGT